MRMAVATWIVLTAVMVGVDLYRQAAVASSDIPSPTHTASNKDPVTRIVLADGMPCVTWRSSRDSRKGGISCDWDWKTRGSK